MKPQHDSVNGDVSFPTVTVGLRGVGSTPVNYKSINVLLYTGERVCKTRNPTQPTNSPPLGGGGSGNILPKYPA
jgi:hypothetical protein